MKKIKFIFIIFILSCQSEVYNVPDEIYNFFIEDTEHEMVSGVDNFIFAVNSSFLTQFVYK